MATEAVSIVFCALLGLACANFKLHQHPSTEELLVSALMKQYELLDSKDVIPGFVNVTVNMKPIRVDGLQDRVLSMVVWNVLEWTDHRLSWENDESGASIDIIHLPIDKIWHPDIELYTADARPQPVLRQPPQAVVYPNGRVHFIPAARIRVYCKEYSEDAEAGTQTCSFPIGSWIYDADKMDVTPGSTELDLQDLSVDDWSIVESHVTRESVFYDCCPDTPYVTVTVSITLAHKVN